MKDSLPNNIPEEKKEELHKLVKIIKSEMRPEFIILFGSYARGDFVEYDETAVEHYVESFSSDFDVLVILSNENVEKDFKVWGKISNLIGKRIDTSVDLIKHNLQFVNEQLANGVPFFKDIKKDGIVLFQKPKAQLANVKNITPVERKETAQRDFDNYMQAGKHFLELFNFSLEKQQYKISSFELHQAVENFFVAIQRVFVRYNPKEHNLEKLEKIVAHFGYEPLEVFPRDNEEEKHLFELLKKAYVEARYSPNFEITKEELEVLFERVREIEAVVERLCVAKIEEL